MMNERAARALTTRIKRQWRDLEELLTEAIVGNIWQPLGYDSFTSWYDAEMSDIPLAMASRNLVVITMFAEKATTKVTDREIAGMIGISPSSVASIKRSWNAGLLQFLPASVKEGRSKPKRRRWTTQFRFMAIRAPIELHHEFQSFARDNHKTLGQVHEEALELYAETQIRKANAAEVAPKTRAKRGVTFKAATT